MVTTPIPHPLTGRTLPPGTAGALLGDLRAVAEVFALARQPDWRGRLVERLGVLHRDFTDHVRLTEGPDGLYTALLADAPRLAQHLAALVREHSAITAGLVALRDRTPGAPFAEVQGRTTVVLRQLAAHWQHGADLLWQAYQTDLGGET